jgi:hypothetical protein
MLAPLPETAARLEWVSVASMRVCAQAQREVRTAWVDKLVAEFDPEQLGILTVNERDGHTYLIDGQHRKLMLDKLGYSDQKVMCRVYSGLTEEQEAEMFLRLNHVLTVSSFEKFKVAITAGRKAESEIAQTVAQLGLRLSLSPAPGTVRCTSTLLIVHRLGGPLLLGRVLAIIRDAFGDPGLEAPVIQGLAALLHRYGSRIDDAVLMDKLTSVRGGVGGVTNKAEVLKRATGKPLWQCVAATGVELLNSGRGGKKLPDWWKQAAARVEAA